MSRFEESGGKRDKELIEMGENNQVCLRGMQQWCKQVEIKQTAAGLYAEMTGLPIGSFNVSCPNVPGASEGMNLDWIFSRFITENCIDCPNHEPNGDISWGQGIIDNYKAEKERREEAVRKEKERISELKKTLNDKLEEIKDIAPNETIQIIGFLQRVFSADEAQAEEASKHLQDSARIGAELFPEEAINLILEVATTREYAKSILPTCVELAEKRDDISQAFEVVALKNIEKRQFLELSSTILINLQDKVDYPIREELISNLLISQNNIRPIGGWREGKPEYKNTTQVLINCFDSDERSLLEPIRTFLQSENEYLRAVLCEAIILLQDEMPELIMKLLEDLFKSLELYEYEEIHTEKPSDRVISIFQKVFRFSPNEIDVFLGEKFLRTRDTIQEEVIRVYRAQFIDDTLPFGERSRARKLEDITEAENLAVSRLLEWAKDEQLDIGIRSKAFEALEVASKYATEAVFLHFDDLLGYFALILDQKDVENKGDGIIIPNQPENQMMKVFKEEKKRINTSSFRSNVRRCIQELCKSKPKEVIDTIERSINQTDTSLHEDFKAICFSLLGQVGKDNKLKQRVLPLLWKGLTDFDSAWIRSKAISATSEIFQYSKIHPPENLVDLIVTFLADQYIVVHKTALDAVSRHSYWLNKKQALEALKVLTAHLKVYDDDIYQIEKICEAILRIGSRYDEFKLISLELVKLVYPVGKGIIDSKIVKQIKYFASPDEDIAKLTAIEIGKFLGRYDKDKYNNYEFSERRDLFYWLHGMPNGIFLEVAKYLLPFANSLAKRDPWESLHFASLFAHNRLFKYEYEVLNTAFEGLSDEPRNESKRAILKIFMINSEENLKLQENNLEGADQLFNELQGEE